MMYGYGRGAGYGGYGMMGGYGGWLALFFGLLVLVGVVLLVIWAVRTMSGPGHDHVVVPPTAPTPPTDDACSIAKLRYAKGEITKDQYEEICKTLGV
jgi:putative membrane protein